MKRLFIASFLICICVCGFAQIQTNILGMQLGVTTESEMLETLKSKGIDFKRDDAGAMYLVNKVEFSKVTWKDAAIIIGDEKVVGVGLRDDNQKNAADMLVIKEALKAKYKDYNMGSFGPISLYGDSKTALCFLSHDSKTILLYVSKEYLMSVMSAFLNEL